MGCCREIFSWCYGISFKGWSCFVLAIMIGWIVRMDTPQAGDKNFDEWCLKIYQEAQKLKIQSRVLNLLKKAQYVPEIIERDRKQPEFKLTLREYLDSAVLPRVNQGCQLLRKYSKELKKISERYKLPPEYIVALWGIESNFGKNQGGFNLFDCLCTLSFDSRRSSFFKEELLAALLILDKGYMPYEKMRQMKSSWAGAMGQCQFMPSSYLKFAVDADQDGYRDIWHSTEDVFASIANYLSSSGWQAREPWGVKVILPGNLDVKQLEGFSVKKTMKEWEKIGVLIDPSYPPPKDNLKLSLIVPADQREDAYLVSQNFEVLLKWNRSYLFAIAVGSLADRLKR